MKSEEIQSLLCRNISFELALAINPSKNEPPQSTLLVEKGELVEEDHEKSLPLPFQSQQPSADVRKEQHLFRDLLIKQLKFYANWYLLEIASHEEESLSLMEENVAATPLLQPRVLLKIRGIATSKNKKPSRWTGLLSLLTTSYPDGYYYYQDSSSSSLSLLPLGLRVNPSSFCAHTSHNNHNNVIIREINMKTLKSLFTELLSIQKRAKRNNSSNEIVESEDVSARPVCCIDDYFYPIIPTEGDDHHHENKSVSRRRGQVGGGGTSQKKLTVSIVDNLSLKDLIDLKGPENLNASDLCLFAKTKKILEEEHQRVREEEALLIQMRDKIFTGYKWPTHLDGINDERYQTLYQWFKTYCTPNSDDDGLKGYINPEAPAAAATTGPEEEEDTTMNINHRGLKSLKNNNNNNNGVLQRKKGLILFSKERRLGKSRFATALVEDNPHWYIHCKGNFNKEAFIKKPEAKLLIIDDFVYQESKHREIFKALISSEPTTIREAYMNYQFDHGLPTIICTNDRKFVDMASKSIYFKNDAYFTRIKEYMGPPNSNPDKDDDGIVHANKDFWEYLEEEEEEESEEANNGGGETKRKNLMTTGSDNNRNTWSNLLHQQQLLLLMKKQQQLSQFSKSNHCPQPNNILESSLVTRRELSPPLMSRLVSAAASNPNVSVSSKE
jgi:hypothetical protein